MGFGEEQVENDTDRARKLLGGGLISVLILELGRVHERCAAYPENLPKGPAPSFS